MFQPVALEWIIVPPAALIFAQESCLPEELEGNDQHGRAWTQRLHGGLSRRAARSGRPETVGSVPPLTLNFGVTPKPAGGPAPRQCSHPSPSARERFQPGILVLGAGALLWAVLNQTQTIDSLLRLLGLERRSEAQPTGVGHTTRDPGSPRDAGEIVGATRQPLIGGEAIPHNLPQATGGAASLIGRDAARAGLAPLLKAGTAPIVIPGMDGVGTTALAFHPPRQRLS